MIIFFMIVIMIRLALDFLKKIILQIFQFSFNYYSAFFKKKEQW